MTFLSSVVFLLLASLAPWGAFACSFDMHSGDVSATTAYIQASFSEASCRDNPTAATAVASVTVSLSRSLSTPLLSSNITVYSYGGLEERQYPGNYVAKAFVTALNANTRYFYRFTAPAGQVSPLGSFRTLPAKRSKSASFVVFTGLNRPPFMAAPALLRVAGSVNFGILLGDGVFATKQWASNPVPPIPTRSFYRDLYGDQRSPAYAQTPALARTMRELPVFSMWDDNDVLSDYAGQSGAPRQIQDRGTTDIVDSTPRRLVEALYRVGTRVFLAMNAVTPAAALAASDPVSGLSDTRRRLFRKVSAGPLLDVFLLDARQYRDLPQQTTDFVPILPRGIGPNFTCEGAYANPFWCAVLPGPHGSQESLFRPGTGRSMLGKTQLRWLLQGLRASKAKYKVIAAPSSMVDLLIAPSEYWSGYWAERERMLRFIERHSIRGVVFVGSGLNAGVISRLNPDKQPAVHEVVGGPIGSFRPADSFGPAIQVLTDILYTFSGNSHLRLDNERVIKFINFNASSFVSIRANRNALTLRIVGTDGNVIGDSYGNRAILRVSP